MLDFMFAFPYIALILVFYRQTNGFIKTYDNFYELWKTLPVLVLSLLCYLVNVGFNSRQRMLTALGLLCGALGDYLICQTDDGLILAAISFGIGHLVYLLTFAHRMRKISIKLTVLASVWSIIIMYSPVKGIISTYPVAALIVLTYSSLLSTCLVLSGSLYYCGGKLERPFQFDNLLRFAGFLLFYLSDSALIIHHTGLQLPVAEKFILITYFMAQYLIFCSLSFNSELKITSAGCEIKQKSPCSKKMKKNYLQISH